MQLILSCWEDRYGHFDTLNVKISPLVQILLVEIHGFANSLRSSSRSNNTKCISIGLDKAKRMYQEMSQAITDAHIMQGLNVNPEKFALDFEKS